MDDVELLKQIRAIVEDVLEQRGFPRLPSAAAQRQKRYRDRKAQASQVKVLPSVTPLVTKRNDISVTKHNGASRVTADIWASYSAAYRRKYGADPVRNAKVNGQIVQLVKRVGEDAIAMADWYVSHGAQRYVLNGHTIGLLLMDAEKLHTEWQTGRRVTNAAAQQSDRTQATGDIFHRLLDEVRVNGKIA